MAPINKALLDSDVAKFGPIINQLVTLVPGTTGTALSSLLQALENPTLLNAAVDAIDAITQAKP
jgi:hypothetical protein